MSAVHFTMGAETFTSGLTREVLRSLTWAQVMAMQGVQRAMVLRDLDRHDIRPLVRLDAATLARFRKGATTLDPQLGEVGDVVLTTEWQSVRAAFASALHFRALEDATLGGPSMEMVAMDDSHGGKMYIPQATRGFPGLIEIRMPADAGKD